MLEGIRYAQQAFERAWTKGYVWDSIRAHTGEDFVKIAQGAIVGAAGGLALVFVGQVGGAVAGSALGAYVSAGNPAAALAMGQAGAAVGRAVAIGACQVLGIAFLVEYVIEHIGECVPHLVAAYDLTVNQCPIFGGDAFDLALDMAARMMAEAVGIFFGLILMALVIWAGARAAKSKAAENFKELTNSKFGSATHGLLGWLIPRLSELRMRTLPKGRGRLRVIEGGMPSSTMTPLQSAIKVAKSLLPKVVNPSTGMIRMSSIKELHRALLAEGFKLIKAESYGPSNGRQLFYRNGNVLVRVKTTGDAAGPRAGKAHMSVGYNDGRGLDWQNDLGKFTANGKVEAKVITDPARFQPADFQGNPQKFVLLPTRFEITQVDAWAGRTHFNAPDGFNLTGVEAIVRTAGQ